MERQHTSSLVPACERALRVVVLLTVSFVTQAPCRMAHAASTNIPPVTQPLEGPQATLERLAQGYRAISPESVLATFTADYRFHAFGDSLSDFIGGRTREDEALSLDGMLHGGGAIPHADSVGMTLNGIREGIDPEHADSTQFYRVLSVGQFEMGMRAGDHHYNTISREHIFHLVRGDVALLVDGQTADADHWYIRRWIEDVTGIREMLLSRQGRCGDPEAPKVGPSSRIGGNITALAIRPLINPACAKLEVTCALPGTEPARVEVFDVSGRLVNRRPVPVTGTGEFTIEAGKGATIIPGVYWVRLSQASRKPSTQMVVVAR